VDLFVAQAAEALAVDQLTYCQEDFQVLAAAVEAGIRLLLQKMEETQYLIQVAAVEEAPIRVP
jgi:hypothetical protein